MPLTVSCRCGKWFAAPDHLAGATVPCPACNSPIAIPAAQPATAPSATMAQQAAAAAPQRPAAAAAPRPAAAPAPQPAAGGLVVSCVCGQSYKAPETLRGKSLPCPKCGRAIQVPGGTPAPAAASQFGLGPLGSSDPLADPLLSASLAGSPLAGSAPAFDPLGRPMAQSPLGSPALGRPAVPYQAQEGPNWILIGSIGGGVALVLLILVGAIVAASFSGGGGTPVASNTNNAVNPAPPATATPATSTPAATPAVTPSVTTTTVPATTAPAATGSTPGVPGAAAPAIAGATPTTAGVPGAPTAAPGATPVPGSPGADFAGGTPKFGPGSPPAGVPGAPPGPGGASPGFPGARPGSAPGAAPGSAPAAGSGAAGAGNAAAGGNNNVQMVKIIPRRDPNGAYETPDSVTPNPKGFGAALPRWHVDSKAKLTGVFRVGDRPRTMTQAHYSWMHNLLPFMGHQDIYDKFDLSKPLYESTNMKFGPILVPEYLVPGNPKQRWEGYPFEHFALTHFVGMSGIEDGRNVVAGKFDRSDPRAGVFGYDRIAAASEITDGTSNTIMVIGVGELANPWVMGGGATIRGARQPYFDKLSGFASHGQSGPIAIMADGSIRVISQNIDPAVFRAMCTIHGAESVDFQAAAPALKLD